MKFLIKDGIQDVYKIRHFQEYLYEIYIDNPEVAAKHPSYIVRNIQMYGAVDFYDMVKDTIESWDRDSKNHILSYNENHIKINIDKADYMNTETVTKRLSELLYKRYFGGSCPELADLNCILYQDDHNMEVFGKGKFRDRVLEDMQYCILCEEINSKELVAVHILEKKMGASDAELTDKNNGLIFCKKHAEQYINKKFYFDELGFARNICSRDLVEGMHLSFAIRNQERKKYLLRRYNILENEGILNH